MEAIGRVRKVKKKVKDGVEKMVEKVTHSSEQKNGDTEPENELPDHGEEKAEVDKEYHTNISGNGDVNIVTEGMEKLEVSRDIKV
jgi:hypothetical protein